MHACVLACVCVSVRMCLCGCACMTKHVNLLTCEASSTFFFSSDTVSASLNGGLSQSVEIFINAAETRLLMVRLGVDGVDGVVGVLGGKKSFIGMVSPVTSAINKFAVFIHPTHSF